MPIFITSFQSDELKKRRNRKKAGADLDHVDSVFKAIKISETWIQFSLNLMSHLALQKVIKSRPAASLALERDVGGGRREIDMMLVCMGLRKIRGGVCEWTLFICNSNKFVVARALLPFQLAFSTLSVSILPYGISKPTKLANKGKFRRKKWWRRISKTAGKTLSSMHTYVLGGKWDIKLYGERVMWWWDSSVMSISRKKHK